MKLAVALATLAACVAGLLVLVAVHGSTKAPAAPPPAAPAAPPTKTAAQRARSSRTPLLNVFQLNEGWHGEAFDFANVTNVDESSEIAPVAPSDGGGPPARVTHKTLDDSAGAQRRIVDGIMQWAAPGG